jgi:hypothetical protein
MPVGDCRIAVADRQTSIVTRQSQTRPTPIVNRQSIR